MIAHLTRRINAPYRCSLKTLLFCINLDWKLSFLISKLIWTRSIFIPVVHKVNGKLQGFFHHEAMLHGEMSGVRAPLGAVRRPKRAVLFLWWSVSFSYEKKKWFKHHYYVIIKFFNGVIYKENNLKQYIITYLILWLTAFIWCRIIS